MLKCIVLIMLNSLLAKCNQNNTPPFLSNKTQALFALYAVFSGIVVITKFCAKFEIKPQGIRRLHEVIMRCPFCFKLNYSCNDRLTAFLEVFEYLSVGVSECVCVLANKEIINYKR